MLTKQIRAQDFKLEQIARTEYPETQLLKQVSGVGTLIALTFILTVKDHERFQKSRDVGCYVGLRPKRSESGQSQPQLPLTKGGDIYLRTMLVQGAHHILGFRGPDTDLRRWGLKLAERGGKNAKKRAIVAVVRASPATETCSSILRWQNPFEIEDPNRHRNKPLHQDCEWKQGDAARTGKTFLRIGRRMDALAPPIGRPRPERTDVREKP